MTVLVLTCAALGVRTVWTIVSTGVCIVAVPLFALAGFLGWLLWQAAPADNQLRRRWGPSARRFRQLVPAPHLGLASLLDAIRQPRRYKADTRLTGAPVLDRELNAFLALIMRDFVNSWYHRISHEEGFSHECRQLIAHIFIEFAKRAKELDPLTFLGLVRQMVDEFVRHLRIYKRAEDSVQHSIGGGTAPTFFSQSSSPLVTGGSLTGSSTSGAAPASASSPAAALSSQLLASDSQRDAAIVKAALGMDVRFQAICTSREAEVAYLRDLSELLLLLLLPQSAFTAKPLRYLFREMVVFYLLLPTVDRLTVPDYVNETIAFLIAEDYTSFDGSLRSIRAMENILDLKILLDSIDRELLSTQQRMEQTDQLYPGEHERAKRSAQRLVLAREMCRRRFRELGRADLLAAVSMSSGGSRDKGRNDLGAEHSALTQGASSKNSAGQLKQLTLGDILRQSACLSYFLDYVASENHEADVLFLIAVDDFRNHSLRAQGADSGTRIREDALALYEAYVSPRVQPRITYPEQAAEELGRLIETQPRPNVFDDARRRVYEYLSVSVMPRFRVSDLYPLCLEQAASPLVGSEASVEFGTAPSAPRTRTNSANSGASGEEVGASPTDNGDREEAAADAENMVSKTDQRLRALSLPPPRRGELSESESGVGLDHAGSEASGDGRSEVGSVADGIFSAGPSSMFTTSAASSSGGGGGDVDGGSGEWSTGGSWHEDAVREELRVTGRTWEVAIPQHRVVMDGRRGKHADYMIELRCDDHTGTARHQVWRRYTDFEDFHMQLKGHAPTLAARVQLPSKKLFGNLDDAYLLERRRKLEVYLRGVLHSAEVQGNAHLTGMVYEFLQATEYVRGFSTATRRIEGLVAPLKTVGKHVKHAVTQAQSAVVTGAASIASLAGAGQGGAAAGTAGVGATRASRADGPERSAVGGGVVASDERRGAVASSHVGSVGHEDMDDVNDENVALRMALSLLDEVSDGDMR
jgi:hypothetical protein